LWPTSRWASCFSQNDDLFSIDDALPPRHPDPAELIITNELLTTVLIGGIASGFGIALILIMGGSSGGIDIVGLYYVKYKRRSSVGAVALAVNTVLYSACLLLFDITTTVYSLSSPSRSNNDRQAARAEYHVEVRSSQKQYGAQRS
jgi:uncharacterized membrane-anchored protein YitT (DUF2179 family)